MSEHVLPDGQHILQHIIEDLLKLEQETDIWDDPPQVFFVLNPGPDDPDRHRVTFLELSPGFWNNKNVPDALAAIALGISMPFAPDPPVEIKKGDEIVGLILRNEVWSISGTGPEDYAEMEAWHKAGKSFADHPRGVEAKMYYGTDGITDWSKTYFRGADEPTEWLSGSEGRLPEVAAKLLSAMRYRILST